MHVIVAGLLIHTSDLLALHPYIQIVFNRKI